MMNNLKYIKAREACLNKQLEKYQVTVDDMIKFSPERDGNDLDWYQFYTFDTKEEYENWKAFCIGLFRKELKMPLKKAEKEFSMLDLGYGLKHSYND